MDILPTTKDADQPLKKPLNIAHRGFSSKAPENTLRAIQLANGAGADCIELDVRLTKDRVPVVLHDANLERTTNVKGLLSDHNCRDLKWLDGAYNSSFNIMDQSEIIPSLELVFQQFPLSRFCLEIKEPNEYGPIFSLINKYKMYDQVRIFSFDISNLNNASLKLANVDTYLLTHRFEVTQILVAKNIGAKGLVIGNQAEDGYWQIAQHNDLEVLKFTVNAENEMKQLVQKGIDGIVTDCPDTMNQSMKACLNMTC